MKKLVYLVFLLFSFHLNADDSDRFFTRMEIWVYPPGRIMPYVGHTWVRLIDSDQQELTYEINPKGMQKNKGKSNRQSVFYGWSIDDLQARKVIEEMESRIRQRVRYNLATNNCVHIIKIALKAAGINHPDFISPTGIPAPSCLHKYISLLNIGYTPWQIAKKYQKHKSFFTPVGTKLSLVDIENK